MKSITIVLTDAEYKAMSLIVVSPEQWVQDAAKNKALSCIERTIKEQTDKQPNKISTEEKETIVTNLNIPTRAEKEALV